MRYRCRTGLFIGPPGFRKNRPLLVLPPHGCSLAAAQAKAPAPLRFAGALHIPTLAYVVEVYSRQPNATSRFSASRFGDLGDLPFQSFAAWLWSRRPASISRS